MQDLTLNGIKGKFLKNRAQVVKLKMEFNSSQKRTIAGKMKFSPRKTTNLCYCTWNSFGLPRNIELQNILLVLVRVHFV